MTENKNVKLSVLNLVPKFQNDTDIDAINRATELIKIVEKLGYHRYWVAEHHNFRGVLSYHTTFTCKLRKNKGRSRRSNASKPYFPTGSRNIWNP